MHQRGQWLTVLNTDRSLQFLPHLIFALFVLSLTPVNVDASLSELLGPEFFIFYSDV